MKTILINGLIALSFLMSCNTESNSENEIELKRFNELTNEEINDLHFLREEEKLARDVYLYAYDRYESEIFFNISNSESRHMDSVLKLLNKYNLKDPASKTIGKFNSETLQNIYNELIEQVNTSLIEALRVGCKIEDMDIYDIEENEKRTSKVDILNVYNSLKCGSRNHLRNFNEQVELNGGVYAPEFITLEEFNSIITTSNEQCGNNK